MAFYVAMMRRVRAWRKLKATSTGAIAPKSAR
jgi:hypothetical protein